MNNRRSPFLLLALLAVALATPGCGVINKLRAKNALNDGVREYNKGKFELAQKQFEHALDLSPDLINAQLYKARALNARFDSELTENLAKDTLGAYDQIISKNPDNHDAVDQSLAFKANIYDQLTRAVPEKAGEYKQLQRDTLEKRANLPWATTTTKADVFYTLGVSYWKECYDLNAGYLLKRQPIPPKVFDEMKPLVQKAHQYLQKAISVDPNYANAWFYEKLVYLEELKYDTAHQKELTAKAMEMQDKYLTIQKQQPPPPADTTASK